MSNRIGLIVLGIMIVSLTVACQGPPGQVGPQGQQGEPGIQGAAGVVGPQGKTGPQGMMGLIGPAGAQGDQGIPGEAGSSGKQGAVGAPGVKGDTGASGPQGKQGAQGVRGLQGEAGIAAEIPDVLEVDRLIVRGVGEGAANLLLEGGTGESMPEITWFDENGDPILILVPAEGGLLILVPDPLEDVYEVFCIPAIEDFCGASRLSE